jgi:hypothetical protein
MERSTMVTNRYSSSLSLHRKMLVLSLDNEDTFYYVLAQFLGGLTGVILVTVIFSTFLVGLLVVSNH